MTRAEIEYFLDTIELHTEVVIETVDGESVTGRIEDISFRYLWLYGHDDYEGTDHDRPWRTRVRAIAAVTRVPDPPKWSWAAVEKRRRERL